MKVNNTNSLGCDVCRQGVYGFGTQPVRIAVYPDGPTFLHRCEVCGTYWEYTISHAYPISEEQAHSDYPLVGQLTTE